MLAQFLKSLISQTSPEQILAWIASAKELQKKGEPRAAIVLYRKALKAGAAHSDVHLQLGVLHAELSEHHAAIGELQKAIEFAPDNADAICMLGTVMSDLRRPNEAAMWFERAIALQPRLSPAHFNLGLARFERADFAGAAASFAQCIALNRGEPWDGARRADLTREPVPAFTPQDMG